MDQYWYEDWKPQKVLHARAEVIEVGEDHTLLRSVSRQRLIRLVALPGDPQLTVGMVIVLFDFMIIETENGFLAHRTKDFRLVPLVGPPCYTHFVELCSGLGAMSIGTSQCDMTPWAAVDCSALAVEVYNMNHEKPAMLGDIMNSRTLAALLTKIGGRRGGVVVGFPCPPFSQRGDQLGFADPRSHVFVQCLNTAYLFDASFMILECTSQTGKWAEINDMLSSLATTLNMTWCSGILRLHRSWPCFRTRWWAVLAPRETLPYLQNLHDLPEIAEFQTVASIIPRWPLWSTADARGLDWLSFEHEQSLIDPNDMLLPLNGKCPTILHSCGHHFFPCPCGCRPGGLSRTRLTKDGVSVIALRSETGVATFRHLHPQEAGLLTTLPPDFHYKMTDARMSLPLIGQLAAPAQAHWVALQLRKALFSADLLDLEDEPDCEQAHVDFLRRLLTLRQHAWPTNEHNAPRAITLHFDNTCIDVVVEPFAKVQHLLQAQCQLQGWAARATLFCDGLRLSPEFYLYETDYEIQDYALRHGRELPSGNVTLRLRGDSEPLNITLPAGSFIAQFLQQADFQYRAGLTLHFSSLRWGDRLWHDLTDELRGFGLSPNIGIGLTTKQVADEADLLVEQATDHFLLVPIDWLNELLLKPNVIVAHQLKQYLEKQLAIRVPFKIILLYCWDQHWALCVYDVLHECTRHFDGIQHRMGTKPRFFADIFADFFHNKVVFYPDHSLLQQQQDDLCGTIALVNLGFVLGLWTDFGYEQAIQWHSAIQQAVQISGCGAHDHASAVAWLTSFLPSRGVPEGKALERATLAIKKLGLGAIIRALAHERPWQQLKALGNQSNRPFLWVTYEELQNHIAERASQQHGIPKNKGKTKKPARDARPVPIVKIDPDQLTLQKGTFTTAKQEPVLQIASEAVKVDSTGISIVSLELAQRFLLDSKKLSTDPLALLTTVAIPTPTPGTLIVETLTWPALLGDEPLLIRGSLVQLGDVHVMLKTGPKQDASVLQTSLLRIQIYREQWPHPWDSFVKGPLKQIIGNFAAFQLCSATSCGASCACFHPAVEETCDMVILDCFAWRWYNEDGASSSPSKASSFAVMLRTPESAVDGLIKLSGKDGLYLEIRENKSSTPSKWIVIWVKMSFEEAQHAIAILSQPAHLARLHKKYGIVTQRKHEVAVRNALFPGQTHVNCDVKVICHVGPWPFGVVKQSVQDFLTNIPWKARAMKPVQGGPAGRFWLVGAEEMPSQLVHPYGEHQITITKQKETSAPKAASNVVASLRTMHRLQGNASASSSIPTPVDPLTLHDPWSAYKKKESAAGILPVQPAGSRFDEIESKLLRAVEDKVKEHASAVSSTAMDTTDEDRVHQLQADLDELRAQTKTHHDWFQETGQRMQTMQQTICDQGVAIEALNHTVGNQVQNTTHLQNSMHTLEHEIREGRQQQSQELQGMMERIEAMMAKKFKTAHE